MRPFRSRAPAMLVALAVVLPGCLGDDEPGPEPARTSPEPAPAGPPADVHVSANLGVPSERQPSMSGFLHGLESGSPPDSLLRPLRPRLWRSIPARAPYERVAGLGARYQFVLSDLWGYPPTHWHGRRPPWEDLDGWARMVRRAARSLRGQPVEWDVWNEPDNAAFFTGTREEFFAVYETAARTLRDELGNPVVGGPSTRRPRRAWTEGLLRHCRRRGCRVDFLSFHANLEPDEPIPPIADRVRELRELVPRYRDLSLDRIEVNESVGHADQYRPGEILGYLHHMEAGGADAAARACWPDLGGSDNCSNGTLDGLFTPDDRPRSAWWAYRAYADGVAGRVPSRSDSPAIAVLASRRDVAGHVQVLLARHDRVGPAPNPLAVELTLRGLGSALSGARSAVATVQLLSDTGEQPLPEPPTIAELPVRVGAGEVTLRPGSLGAHQAMIVTVAPR
ncbi:MAG TPA: hypothetical protein VFQ12_07050 [Thermoleophilaceae bacterium]|nr:hypothetical protein [Thermoleophilaceae bacterium]